MFIEFNKRVGERDKMRGLPLHGILAPLPIVFITSRRLKNKISTNKQHNHNITCLAFYWISNAVLFVCFDVLRPSQHFNHIGTISCLPGLY